MLDPERRTLLATVAGVTAALAVAQAHAGSGHEPEHLLLQPNGAMPNNPHLPVLVFRKALPVRPSGDPAAACEALFRAHGWPPQWRAGVFAFHHYHSTAHEVLGVVRGGTRLMLGGPGGRVVAVQAGDVVVLPAGTGHCNLTPDADLLVVGAYPPDQVWDICRGAPDGATRRRMAALPFPASDPVGGASGALPRLWSAG